MAKTLVASRQKDGFEPATPDSLAQALALKVEEASVEQVRASLMEAVAAGHSRRVSKSAYELGLLLASRGDVDGAKEAFQRPLEKADTTSSISRLGDQPLRRQAAKCTYNSALLSVGQGDVEGAIRAFEDAAGSFHPHFAPLALVNLSLLLAGQRDLSSAKAFYQRVVFADPKRFSLISEPSDRTEANLIGPVKDDPRPEMNFAGRRDALQQLAAHGSLEETAAAFREAIKNGHPGQRSKAAHNLGVYLARKGHSQEARAAFEEAIESGIEPYAEMAAYHLGLLAAAKDTEAAKAAFRLAMSCGGRCAPIAAYKLGLLCLRGRNLQGARTAFQEVIDLSHERFRPRVAYELARKLRFMEEMTLSKAALEYAVAANSDYSAKAAYRLAERLRLEGDIHEATRLFHVAFHGVDVSFRLAAAYHLAELRYDSGDIAGARRFCLFIIDATPKDRAPRAAYNVALKLASFGDVAGAKKAFEDAARADDRRYCALAWYGYGLILTGQGDLTEAREAFGRAVTNVRLTVGRDTAYCLPLLIVADKEYRRGLSIAWRQRATALGRKTAESECLYRQAMAIERYLAEADGTYVPPDPAAKLSHL